MPNITNYLPYSYIEIIQDLQCYNQIIQQLNQLILQPSQKINHLKIFNIIKPPVFSYHTIINQYNQINNHKIGEITIGHKILIKKYENSQIYGIINSSKIQ